MKASIPLFLAILTAVVWSQTATTFAATAITVNSTNNNNAADSEMTLQEAILYLNELQGQGDSLGRALSAAESNQVATIPGTTNFINFNISGTGPHFIKSPISTCSFTLWEGFYASNVVVNGYSQPGSFPNTNPILAPNNAVIQIVIDSRNTANSCGDATFAIVGDNVSFRGLSVLGDGAGTAIYYLSFDTNAYPCIGGKVQGCWIGVAPDRTNVAGLDTGVYIYNTTGGQVVGTDGDGVNDRNEFNVIVGSTEMGIGIESEQLHPTGVKIAGNFIGVMPDGLSPMPAYALAPVYEGDGFEADGAQNLIFGTDSDGIADEDERNIVGGLTRGIPQHGCEALELWGGATSAKVMGNYFGVGIDGLTPLGNTRFMTVASGSTVQIGSDGDGVRDDIEANIIANHSDYLFSFSSPTTQLIFLRNSFFGNTGNFFNDPANSYNGALLGTGNPALISPVISNATTRTELVGWVPVSTNAAANNRTAAEIAIYVADPVTSATKPQGRTWLASYTDNGPQDLDPATNSVRFNICSLPIPSTGASLVVQETVKDDISAGSSQFSSALSLPDVSNAISVFRFAASVTVSWEMNGTLQAKPNLASGSWTNVPGCFSATLPVSAASLFFRVAQ